ncbi:uncharacterized protein LOC126267004 isoform X2 [Schistocerca gregaria]|uniref:uncharacterized protein LOC126267004 isoform X2 n=1 Tax=Schistocerca gregaria TaxID=7010 RepID=UPI00211E2FC9|nr:uncharacterized protein LOC126267004 isoform X2 [Schistocerca gregaria]
MRKTKIPQTHKYITPWELLHKSASDYIVSKQTEKWPMKAPLIDSAPATTLLSFIHASCDAQSVSEDPRHDLKEQAADLQKFLGEIIHSSEQLKKSIIASEKLITLSENERERLKRKLSAFDPTRRYHGIEETQAAVDQLDSVAQSMEKQLQSLSIYEEFLKKVVHSDSMFKKANTSFKNQDDIILRYMVLLDAQKHAAERANLLDCDADGARATMENLHQNHAAKLTGLRTIWANLQEKSNATKADVSFWEGNLAIALKTTLSCNTDTERVKQAIKDLYEKMCAQEDIEETDKIVASEENQDKFEPEYYEKLLTEIKAAIKRVERVLKISLSEAQSAGF